MRGEKPKKPVTDPTKPRPDKARTPVMQQFDDAKRAYPDALVFFRLGDFYELFYEDAVFASGFLGLTLTARGKGTADEAPMAGVPHHAAHGYIAKLLAAGRKVALCEQLADPSKVKGIVPREVVRVLTPGLVTSGELDAREHNYLAAVEFQGQRESARDGAAAPADGAFGLALLDLSTGELAAGVLGELSALFAELVRASPREVLVGASAESVATELGALLGPVALRLRGEVDAIDAPPNAVLAEQLGEAGARDAASTHAPVALAAAARVIAYAKRYTPARSLPITRVELLDPRTTMQIDETAQAHLELVRALDGSREGTLLSVLDRTVTPAGARLLKKRVLAPLLDVARIRARQDEVEAFVVHARARSELREELRRVGDLERLAVRAALGEATPRDLGALRDGLDAFPRIRAIVASLPGESDLAARASAIDAVDDVAAALREALAERPPVAPKDGGIVRDGLDRELDRARASKRDAAVNILELEARLRAEANAPNLKIGFNSVFGYYIEVTRSQLAKVPPAWSRKQTIAGGERYTLPALDQLAADIESADGRALERELAIFAELVELVTRSGPRVRALAAALAEWDVAACLAEVAHAHDYTRPIVDAGDRLAIEHGRHPVVERHSALGRFVPNDTELDLGAAHLWLVTGPNMSGKSTLMRQVALIVVCAQIGAFVPAKRAVIGAVDRLLSRVGASDAVARGDSTFMVEMRETASILRYATRRSLVILDEIGRGTSTYDGLAIAWAVAEHLADRTRCRALFATHYHELTELPRTHPMVVNVSVAAREQGGKVVFLHSLVRGPASRSYGIAVARLAGVPESVTERAEKLLALLEESSARPERHGAKTTQMPLFGEPPSAPARPKEKPRARGEEKVLEAVRTTDVDRMTPLEALTLLAKLKRQLD